MQDNMKKISEVMDSKQTQTLGNINIDCESERIECGKYVFINIYKGKPIPKHYLIDCVLCYMKNNNASGGCVLMGFSREEIMIFEGRLAKKHFPPFGSYQRMEKTILTILVPFKGPDLGEKGRYMSSFTCYLKVRH